MTAGIKFGRPARLLDAATTITRSWNAISQVCIFNFFKKAEIIIRFERFMEIQQITKFHEDARLNDVAERLKACSISSDLSFTGYLKMEIESFLQVDDKESK